MFYFCHRRDISDFIFLILYNLFYHFNLLRIFSIPLVVIALIYTKSLFKEVHHILDHDSEIYILSFNYHSPQFLTLFA